VFRRSPQTVHCDETRGVADLDFSQTVQHLQGHGLGERESDLRLHPVAGQGIGLLHEPQRLAVGRRRVLLAGHSLARLERPRQSGDLAEQVQESGRTVGAGADCG